MWLSYHTPLTDLRAFSNVQTGKLPQPEWASAGPKIGFIRGFGAMTSRQPTDTGWMHEPQVCDARGVLRIPPYVSLLVAGRKRLPKILFRQVASDGGAVVHLDLGMWINLGSTALDGDASTSLLAAALDMPVGVHIPRPNSTDLSEGRLLRSGPALAEAWLWATTATSDTPPGDGWVLDGMPILFVTLGKEEALELPESIRYTAFAPEVGIHLRHFILVHRGQPARIYVLQLTPEADLSRAFALEVCLKRLHIETVCTRTVLHRLGQGEGQPAAAVLSPPAPANIAPTPQSPASDRLQRNLLDISRRLRRFDRLARGLSPSEMPIHAGLGRPEIAPEQVDTAIQRVDAALRHQNVRPNVARSLRETLYRLPGVLDEESPDVQSLWSSQRAAALPQDPPIGNLAQEYPSPGDTDQTPTLESDTASLQWNTGFPHDATAEKVRVLFVGVSYLLRTAIQAGQNTIGGLTPGEALQPPGDEDLEVTAEGEKFFTVRFAVRATGAVIRPANSQIQPSPEAISDSLRCMVSQGTQAFDLDLVATAAGPIEVELTLYVNGGAVLRRTFALTAIDLVAGAPPMVSEQPTVEGGQPTAEIALSEAGGALLSSTAVNSPGATISPTWPRTSSSTEVPTVPVASLEGTPGLDTAALTVESMLSLPATAISLKVSFRDDKYRLELVVDPSAYGPVAVDSGEEVLVNTVIAQRNELIRLSSAYRAEAAQAGDPLAGLRILEPSDALLSFARVGVRLHRALFGRKGDSSVAADLLAMAGTIEQMGRGTTQPSRMQIDAEFLPIPWAVLYDGEEPATAADVDLESFWGVRFQVHRVARVSLTQVPSKRSAAGQRRITACLNPNLDEEQKIAVLQSQRTFFQTSSVKGTLIESGTALKEFLQTTVDQAPCNFLYFFCHATAAQTLNRNLFRDPTSPRDATTIELDKPPISVEQLRDIRIKPLPAQPLVFMNTCSSAQGDSVFQSVFLTHFFGTWRASGFIGTDWTMPTVFADGFARVFLKLFLVDRQPVSTAFYNVARQALELGNPFPMIYALYVRPDFTL